MLQLKLAKCFFNWPYTVHLVQLYTQKSCCHKNRINTSSIRSQLIEKMIVYISVPNPAPYFPKIGTLKIQSWCRGWMIWYDFIHISYSNVQVNTITCISITVIDIYYQFIMCRHFCRDMIGFFTNILLT